jgi:hypothetical protein
MGNKLQTAKQGDTLKPKSISKILDYIASYYIVTSDFSSLKKLYKKEYCDDLVVLTSDIIQRNFTDLEITYLAQRIKNGEEVNEEAKDNFIFFNNKMLNDLDIQNSVKKKRVCIAISKFYIKIAHIFAAIVTTINPVYVYKDEMGNTARATLMDKSKIPVNAPRDIYKLNICDNRINSLNKKSLEEDASGNITVGPNFCSINLRDDGTQKSLEDEPGIPELEQLYYDDNYDFETGKFTKMSENTKKAYLKDLSIFYETFTGKKNNVNTNLISNVTKIFTGKSDDSEKDLIERFSDIKLRDYNKMDQCRGSDAAFKYKYKGPKTEKLFEDYAENLKQMIKKANRNQEALLSIINQIFVYTIDPQTTERKIRINPTLTEDRLQELVVETRALIIKLYLTCEMDYVNGLKLFEAIVEQKILDTAQNQIKKLEKISDQLIIEQHIPELGSEVEVRENAEKKIEEKKEELGKQLEEVKKDEELIEKNPGEVLKEDEKPIQNQQQDNKMVQNQQQDNKMVQNQDVPPQDNKMVPPIQNQEVPPQDNKNLPQMPPQDNKNLPQMPPQDNKMVPANQNKEQQQYNNNLQQMPPIQNQEVPPIQNQEVPPQDNKIVPPIQNQEVPPIQNQNVPPIQNQNVPPIQNQNVPPIQNQNVPPIQNQEQQQVPPIQNQAV